MDRGAYIYSCPILRFAQERKPQQPSQRATLLDESLWNIKNPRLNFQNSTSKTNLCFAVGWCMTCAALRLTLIWLFWGCLQRRRKNWTSINRLESLDQPINQPWHFRRHHRLEKTSNKNSQKWVNPNISMMEESENCFAFFCFIHQFSYVFLSCTGNLNACGFDA